MQDVVMLKSILDQYVTRHYKIIYTAYVATYIFIQSFAIPGRYVSAPYLSTNSIPLAVLGGSLFGAKVALVTVTAVSSNSSHNNRYSAQA